MSSARIRIAVRLLAVAALAALTAGCFQPMYAERADGTPGLREKLMGVELPPIDDPSTQAVEKTTAGALPASLYQFENAGKKLAVVTIDRGQTIVFVRFSGPAAAVDAQKANFDSFLQSFQW